MVKKVFAVQPCIQEIGSNFKQSPFKAWRNIGGNIASNHYPPRKFYFIGHYFDFPTIKLSNECRLRFVEACTLNFDCFPEYIFYETIPIIWDCWPHHWKKTEMWLKRHKVKCAIFTSSQVADEMKQRLPNINILTITEGIDIEPYHCGDILKNRSIDLLEYGRVERNFFRDYVGGINHVNTRNSNGRMRTWDLLVKTMCDAKVTVALPRCDTDLQFTGGIETLTQRFWEGMLSRSVLIGRAPKELIEHIGYNPVIDINKTKPDQQVRDILSHIEDYQEFVDKNRETALRMAPWEIRMKQVMEWLTSLGYEI